jgi:hypothetical protein
VENSIGRKILKSLLLIKQKTWIFLRNEAGLRQHRLAKSVKDCGRDSARRRLRANSPLEMLAAHDFLHLRLHRSPKNRGKERGRSQSRSAWLLQLYVFGEGERACGMIVLL